MFYVDGDSHLTTNQQILDLIPGYIQYYYIQ